MPGRTSIDPAAFPPLLRGIYLIEVTRQPEEPNVGFRFRLAGTEHFEINQMELTGLTIEEAFTSPHLELARAAYTEVVTTRQPMLTLGARSAVIGRSHVLFDRLLLPLASDGTTVDMLLGYLRRQRLHQR